MTAATYPASWPLPSMPVIKEGALRSESFLLPGSEGCGARAGARGAAHLLTCLSALLNHQLDDPWAESSSEPASPAASLISPLFSSLGDRFLDPTTQSLILWVSGAGTRVRVFCKMLPRKSDKRPYLESRWQLLCGSHPSGDPGGQRGLGAQRQAWWGSFRKGKLTKEYKVCESPEASRWRQRPTDDC